MAGEGLYGLLAEFEGPAEVLRAAQRVHAAGYRQVEAYSPMPVEGLAEALEFRRTGMARVVLLGAILGGLVGYGFQVWVSVYAYPHNIGGRPLHSWPAFIPVTFEMTVLVGALAGVLGMLGLNGLPRPHHPLFAVPQFSRATRDGFFLSILATDPKFDDAATRQFLTELEPKEVIDVPS
jgi:hypothetical protein